MNDIKVIGFGGHLDKESLFKTLSERPMKPCWVKRYKRVFNLKSRKHKEKKEGGDVLKSSILNMEPEESSETNAILFSVTPDELELLKIRNGSYYSKDVPYYDYKTKKELGKAVLFIGKKMLHGERIVLDDILPLPGYLERVRKGAYSVSEEFGEEFDNTTFITDGRTVGEYLNP